MLRRAARVSGRNRFRLRLGPGGQPSLGDSGEGCNSARPILWQTVRQEALLPEEGLRAPVLGL